MPRKKSLPKYVVIKDAVWYVRKKIKGVKYPVWRVCKDHTQEAVDQILEELKTDAAEAKVPLVEGSPTMNAVFDDWLESIQDEVSVRTFADYTELLQRYFREPIGDKDPRTISEPDIKTVLTGLRDRGLSKRTRQYAFRVLNQAIKAGVKAGSLPGSPMENLKAPRVKSGDMIVFDHVESRHFFEVCDTVPHGVIFQFALESGMRPEEYLALKWSDLDFSKYTASVNRVVVHSRNSDQWWFEHPKTKKSRRSVRLSPKLFMRLKRHRKRQDAMLRQMELQDNHPEVGESLTTREARKVREAAYRLQAIANHKEHDLVFPNKRFTPYNISNIGRREFQDVIRLFGGKKGLTLKSLRHTMATLMLKEGIHPKIVSERLGHASVVITLDIYSHVLPTMQDEASGKLAKMLY